jgi:hypothetical protein
MRSAERVGDARLGAIAEGMVDGGDKVRDVDRVVGRHASLPVAAAHDLPATHAAAGEHRRIDAAPMIPAGALVDQRRVAELARPCHQRFVQQAPLPVMRRTS